MQAREQPQTQTFYTKIRARLGRIDTRAGRRVFGDDNPLTRHIRSSVLHNVIRLKAQYRAPEGPRLFDVEEMREKGYMVFEGLYDEALVKPIQEKVNEAFKREGSYEQRSGKYSLRLTQSFIDIPEIGQILKPEIINALCDYYQAYIDIATVNAWRNLPPDEEAPHGVYSSTWHTDRRMPIMTKLFYLVRDTTEQDGPFHIMNRPTTRRIIQGDYKTRFDPGPEVDNPDNHLKLTGKAGSILIGNTTQCMHKAGLPEPGHFRDLIQFQFLPSANPLPENWVEDESRCHTELGKKAL